MAVVIQARSHCDNDTHDASLRHACQCPCVAFVAMSPSLPPNGRPRRSRRATTRCTIKDVARLAGVSVASVTRTFQGSTHVSDDLRRRVLEAAERLGYRPHHAAQALATGTSRAIGLLVPSLGDRFWGEVADGIERAAAEAGYSVILATSHGQPARARESLRLLLDKGVDGVIAAGSLPRVLPVSVLVNPEEPLGADDLFDAAGMAEVGRSDQDGFARGSAANREVVFDDLAAAASAVGHLTDLGHTRIAFVGAARSRTAAMRIVGFRQGLQARGLQPMAILECDASLTASRLAAESLLSTARSSHRGGGLRRRRGHRRHACRPRARPGGAWRPIRGRVRRHRHRGLRRAAPDDDPAAKAGDGRDGGGTPAPGSGGFAGPVPAKAPRRADRPWLDRAGGPGHPVASVASTGAVKRRERLP